MIEENDRRLKQYFMSVAIWQVMSRFFSHDFCHAYVVQLNVIFQVRKYLSPKPDINLKKTNLASWYLSCGAQKGHNMQIKRIAAS